MEEKTYKGSKITLSTKEEMEVYAIDKSIRLMNFLLIVIGIFMLTLSLYQ